MLRCGSVVRWTGLLASKARGQHLQSGQPTSPKHKTPNLSITQPVAEPQPQHTPKISFAAPKCIQGSSAVD